MQRFSNSTLSSEGFPASLDHAYLQATLRRMDEVQLTEFLLEIVGEDVMKRIATRVMARAHSVRLPEICRAPKSLVVKTGLAKRTDSMSPVRKRHSSRKPNTRAKTAAKRSRSSPDVDIADTLTSPQKRAGTFLAPRTIRHREATEYARGEEASSTEAQEIGKQAKPASRNASAPPKSCRTRGTFSCSECPYISSDRRGIDNHRKAHGRVAPYQCLHCSYASTGSAVAQHMKVHVGLEPDPVPPASTKRKSRVCSPTPASRNKRKQAAPGRLREKRKKLQGLQPPRNLVPEYEEVMKAHDSLHRRAPDVNGPSSSNISHMGAKRCVVAPMPRQTAVVVPQAAVSTQDGNATDTADDVGHFIQSTSARSPERTAGYVAHTGTNSPSVSAIRDGNIPSFVISQRKSRPKTSYGSRKAIHQSGRLPKPTNPLIPVDCVQCGYHAKNWRALVSHRSSKHKQLQSTSERSSTQESQTETESQERPDSLETCDTVAPAFVFAAPPMVFSSRILPTVIPVAQPTVASTDLPAVALVAPGSVDDGRGSASPAVQSDSPPLRARSVDMSVSRPYPQPGVIRFVGSAAHTNDGPSSGIIDTDWEDVQYVPPLPGPTRRPGYTYGRSHTSFGSRSHQ